MTTELQETGAPNLTRALEEQAAQAAVRETLQTPDGWIVDVETGEVLGHLYSAHIDGAREMAGSPGFDRSYAEWALEKMQDAQAVILCEDSKLRAISDNIQYRIKQQQRRLDWLRNRFSADLERLAMLELAGGKSRTLVLDHGRISFRKTPGRIEITDQAAALAWADENCPEAVKVSRSVLVTPLKGRDDLPAEIFETVPPGERCTIETGIRTPEREIEG